MSNSSTIEVQNADVSQELSARFPDISFVPQVTVDDVPTLWVPEERIKDVLRFLKEEAGAPFRTLYDLTAIDERTRVHRDGQPDSDFTIVYHLLSYDRNSDVRIKVALKGDQPAIPTVTSIWQNANWYEREVWDMFGVRFQGHPDHRRILLPPTWEGHPLRKDHPARATEMGPYILTPEKQDAEQEALKAHPEQWGFDRDETGEDFLYLNLGPQHPGTHGPFRIILKLRGEEIVQAVPDIGYHHRGQEKMAERQSWHTYVPYTDRVDYLSGVANELSYLMSLERLAGIPVPPRAQVIRVMMTELFRLSSHLVFYGTFGGDIGQLSPVFYMFTDRERILEIVEAICGARMHPVWFRIGGVAQDLPDGWDRMIRYIVDYLPPRLDEYDKMVMNNAIVKARTVGVGQFSLDEAIEWGASGPNLRACGLEWDFRKKRPYSGYEQFDFEVPTFVGGDCYSRARVHVEEMRQSVRIIKQCLDNMPSGDYKSRHRLATPPIKDPNTMHDIETLIHHFLNVSYGPPVPPGECQLITEGSKGAYSYYCVSDGNTMSYRTRLRTPSFAHLQMLPMLSKGVLISDLLAILGAVDFVLSDVDR